MRKRKKKSTGLFDNDDVFYQRKQKRVKRSSIKNRMSRLRNRNKLALAHGLITTPNIHKMEKEVNTLSNEEIIKLIFRLARLELRKEGWHEKIFIEGDDLDMRMKIQRSNIEYNVSICRYENCISVSVSHTDKRNSNTTTDHRREIPASNSIEELYYRELDLFLTDKSKVQYDSSMEDAIVAAFGDIQDELVLGDDTNILEIVDKRLEEENETEGDNS